MNKNSIIAVSNQKGGVAKTATVRNLGWSLAELGKRVLTVDFDPQANLTINCGIDRPEDLNDTIATLMTNLLEDEASFICTYGMRSDLILTTFWDTLILKTSGPFITQCWEQDWLERVLNPVLIPMQTGELEALPITILEETDEEDLEDDEYEDNLPE